MSKLSGKSNIKREYILDYLKSKFNSTTQGVGFVMGIDGMELYRPITSDGTQGNPDTQFEFDEATYKLVKSQNIPVSFPVIEADYANLKTINGDKRINTTSFTVVASMLVFVNSYVHNKLMFAVEEFRDKFLGDLDVIQGREYDYDDASKKPITKYYTVATSAGDIVPQGIIEINGDLFLEYIFNIDLDISDGIAYGNQFEFYIGNKRIREFELSTKTYFDNSSDAFIYEDLTITMLDANSNDFKIGSALRIGVDPNFTYYRVVVSSGNEIDYRRVLPIQASWGASNSLNGYQLLRNVDLSELDKDKAKMIHNLVASRGWAINFTFFFEANSYIIRELFKETYKMKDKMNKGFNVKMVFRRLIVSGNVPKFEVDNDIGFEYDVITGEGGTEVVYGDTIMFTIGFSPSWKSIVEQETEV